MEWYWRAFRSDELFGPVNFVLADRQARELSRTSSSGVSEVVTFEGDRLFSAFTYLRGKLRYRGKKSRDAARLNLPPTV